jgi:hypothetical protein
MMSLTGRGLPSRGWPQQPDPGRVFHTPQHRLIELDYAAMERRILASLMRFHEGMVRELLGRWVSELEPVLVFSDGRFQGLGAEGAGVVLPAPREQADAFWVGDLHGDTTWPAHWAITPPELC